MPYCAVLECKNDSRIKNKSHGGVSYHKFPKDPFVKEIWINATGRKNWIPTKSSGICSEHFNETDFEISAKGYKYITDGAVPTQKILTFHVHIDDYDENSKKRRSRSSLSTSESSITKVQNEEINFKTTSLSSDVNSKGTLKWAKNKIVKQHLKINRLQAQNRRLKKKLIDTLDLLKKVEEKFPSLNEEVGEVD